MSKVGMRRIRVAVILYAVVVTAYLLFLWHYTVMIFGPYFVVGFTRVGVRCDVEDIKTYDECIVEIVAVKQTAYEGLVQQWFLPKITVWPKLTTGWPEWAEIILPNWLLFVLSLLAMGLLLRCLSRDKTDQALLPCPGCAYDLTGNTSGICPECGTPIPEETLKTLTTDPPKQ
jgi:hypothetical protein